MISEPFSGIFGPVVVGVTSNTTAVPLPEVASARTGLKSRQSRK